LKSAKCLEEFLSVLTWCYNVTKPSPLECFVCLRQVCGGRPVEAQGTLVFVTWWDFRSPEDIKRKPNKFCSIFALVYFNPAPPHPTSPHPTLPSMGTLYIRCWSHSGNALVGRLPCTYFQGFVPDFLRFF
jgi:hypothetical protein